MTALAEAQFRIQGFSVGAVDYVTKLFETTELLARVQTQLSLRRATRSLEAQNARLSEEIRERLTAQEVLAEANAQLSQELVQHGQAEAAKGALQEQIIAAQRERLFELSGFTLGDAGELRPPSLSVSVTSAVPGSDDPPLP